jgi:GAF domain-containing protein
MVEPFTGDSFEEALADLAHAFGNRFEVTEVLYRLAGHLGYLLSARGVGVGLVNPHGTLRSVTAVNELTADLDTAQDAYGEGPLIDAFTRGHLVAVEDPASMSGRWPRWSPHARQRGVMAVLGVPLRAADGPLGALNLYSLQVRRWDQREQRTAQLLCDLTASYVADRIEIDHARQIADQLEEALTSRVVIEQAKGVLAAHYGVSLDLAFSTLREHARRHNLMLPAVASAVVHDGLRPPPRPPPPSAPNDASPAVRPTPSD